MRLVVSPNQARAGKDAAHAKLGGKAAKRPYPSYWREAAINWTAARNSAQNIRSNGFNMRFEAACALRPYPRGATIEASDRSSIERPNAQTARLAATSEPEQDER